MDEQIVLKGLGSLEYMTMEVVAQNYILCRPGLGKTPKATPSPKYRTVLLPGALYQSSPIEPIESLLEAGHPFFIPTKVQSSRTSPSSGFQVQ
jgi:hypothetical protein